MTRRFFAALLSLLLMGAVHADAAAWRIYDAVLAPHAKPLGLPCHVIYGRTPETAEAIGAEAKAAAAAGALLVFDYEFPPEPRTPRGVATVYERYNQHIAWARAAAPGLSIAYYQAPPANPFLLGHSDYLAMDWYAVHHASVNLGRELDVDALTPALYAVEDAHLWERGAARSIELLRMHYPSRPIYAFVCPQRTYKAGDTGLIDAVYWKAILAFCRSRLDGIVVWAGPTAAVGEDEEWVKAVRAMAAAPDPIVAAYLIGGSSADDATRRINQQLWRIKDEGWAGMIEAHIRPAIKWGARRHVIINPGGTISGQAMQFDQFLEASADGHDYLVKDFAAAFKSLIDAQAAAGEPVEVLVYLGALRPEWDPRFAPLPTPDPLGRFLAAWSQIHACVQPVVAGGCHGIVLDASASQRPGALADTVAAVLESDLVGMKVWAEAWPHRNTRWTRMYIVDTVYDSWKAMPAMKAMTRPRAELSECIVLMTTNDPAKIRAVVKGGDAAAVNTLALIRAGVTRAQLEAP